MTSPTAIVAEDEATLRHQLVEQLGQLWPELEIVGEAADGVQALRLLDEHRPDVLFLDIQMPGATGLEVARQASGRCHVVFVTAYDQHAVAAFEQGAVDYVLKPVSAARLFTAVSRAQGAAGHAAGAARRRARASSPRRSASSEAAPALDQRLGRPEPEAHHGRGDLLFPGRQQVHAGRHRARAKR